MYVSWARRCVLETGRQEFDLTNSQTVTLSLNRTQAEAFSTNSCDAKQPIASLVPICHARQGPYRVGRCLPGLITFADQQYAEWLLRLHATTDHVEIPGLKNPQRQGTTRKKHCVQGKKRNLHDPQSIAAGRQVHRPCFIPKKIPTRGGDNLGDARRSAMELVSTPGGEVSQNPATRGSQRGFRMYLFVSHRVHCSNMTADRAIIRIWPRFS